MSSILFYNTRTRKKENFQPLEEGRVGIYTCGPTVYGPQHIGNVRSQLFADLLPLCELVGVDELEHLEVLGGGA